MPNNTHDIGRVSGLKLKKAFENLAKDLGRSIVDLLVYDLERQGISLGQDEYYRLDEIRQIFERTFGEDGAALLVGKLRKGLE